MKLTELSLHKKAQIEYIQDDSLSVFKRLQCMGFLKGDTVELIHQIPLGGPLVVRVRGALIALSRELASKILITEVL